MTQKTVAEIFVETVGKLVPTSFFATVVITANKCADESVLRRERTSL
jgi:hypothetical protein